MPYQICGLLISSVSCLFFLLFCCAELIILLWSHLFTFVLIAVLLGSIQKTVAKTNIKEHVPYLFFQECFRFLFLCLILYPFHAKFVSGI